TLLAVLVLWACDAVLGVDDLAIAVCDEGARRCSGPKPQICTTGQWHDAPGCDGQTCIDGVATGKRCDGRKPQMCDAAGPWQSARDGSCVRQACIGGACVGECAPADKRCKGLTPEACDENGQWKKGATCDASLGLHCSGGTCVESCTPGDFQCVAN